MRKTIPKRPRKTPMARRRRWRSRSVGHCFDAEEWRSASCTRGEEGRRANLQSMARTTGDMPRDDEQGGEEEAREEGAGDEDRLESDDGGGRAEGGRNGRVSTLVEPLLRCARCQLVGRRGERENGKRTRARLNLQNSRQRALPAIVMVFSSPRVKPRRARRETM